MDSSLAAPDLEFSAIYKLAGEEIFLANDNDDEDKKQIFYFITMSFYYLECYNLILVSNK